MLKISLLGHRKRIIASLVERPYEEPPVKPPRLSQIRVRTLNFTHGFIPTSGQRKHRTTVCSHSVSSVPGPAWIPVLVSPQSDGLLHRSLNGPSAAGVGAYEEKSARRRLRRRTKIPKRTAQITCMFGFIPLSLAVHKCVQHVA